MSPRSIGLSDALQAYVDAHSSTPDEVQRRLIGDTEALGERGRHADLARAGDLPLDARRHPATVVRSRGRHVHRLLVAGHRTMRCRRAGACCAATSARSGRPWPAAPGTDAGVADRIDLRIGPAIDTLPLPERRHRRRLRVHRRRQGWLHLLLRGTAGPTVADRNDRRGQHPVVRCRRRRHRHEHRHRGHPCLQHPRRIRPPHRAGDHPDRRRPDPDPPRVTTTDDHAVPDADTAEPGADTADTAAGDTSAAAAPAKPKLADAVVALQIPAFRRFWLAAIASNSGSWLQGLAMPFIMYDMTESGAWVGPRCSPSCCPWRWWAVRRSARRPGATTDDPDRLSDDPVDHRVRVRGLVVVRGAQSVGVPGDLGAVRHRQWILDAGVAGLRVRPRCPATCS